MKGQWVYIEDQAPTVPRLTHDLAGFVKYVEAVNDFHAKAALSRFRSIIKNQAKSLKDKTNEA